MAMNLHKGDNVNRLHSKVIDTIPYTFKHKSLTIKSNNMKKLEDLKKLPENMLEIKEDRSEISLKDLIDNFYT